LSKLTLHRFVLQQSAESPFLRILRLRADLLARTREFFGSRGFLEVETPLVSADLILDREIEPFKVLAAATENAAGAEPLLYLQTSPEAHLKRLLVRGAGAIYEITRSFRADERGPLHHREFTIVEWYRLGDDVRAGIQLLSDLCDLLLRRGAAEVVTYREAFLHWAGVDPFAASIRDLQAASGRNPGSPPAIAGDDRDAWLDYLMATAVGPRLGRAAPTIVCDFPAAQAALAKVRDESPPVAERFELFVEGIELANGYHEETAVEELARRQAELRRRRAAQGKPPLPSANRWLEELAAGLPMCAGVALGFDRVVMLAAGLRSLAEVLQFVEE
jgi:lysyl-tRNA synthetase class 2